MAEQFVTAVAVEALADNKSTAVEINGVSILVCSAGGEYFAVENKCSHQAKPLEGGRIRSGCISCPVHGMRFRLNTGEPLGQLTRIPLKTFPVRVQDGQIEVQIDQSQAE